MNTRMKTALLVATLGMLGALGAPMAASAQSAAIAPASCSVTGTATQATVGWDREPNDGASTFIIRRSRNGGAFGWTGRVDIPGTTFTQTISSRSTYEYTVEAKDSAGQSTAAVLCINDGGGGNEDPIAPTSCQVTQIARTATLEWTRAANDNVATFIIRRSRNGGAFGWTGRVDIPGTTFTQNNLSLTSTYEYRVDARGTNGTETTTACVTPSPVAGAERVLHISIDGLRSDYVNAQNMPTLQGLIDGGVSTLNARSDFNATITLPNHIGQLTSRRQLGPDGFNVLFNEDDGGTVHDKAGFYVASSFDVAHDHGRQTFALVGKEKFDFLDRSWNAINGLPDAVGVDNGADKIDEYTKNFAIQGQTDLMLAHVAASPADYIFWHVPHPDGFGHPNGWGSDAYNAAVQNSDASIGTVLAAIAADPGLASTTAVIITADHGGPLGFTSHTEHTDDENYTVPFIVWGSGVGQGDLYSLNPAARTDPGTGRPDENGLQPVRAAEAGNLSLQLLGLPSIPGSRYNASHDLNLDQP